MRRCALYLAAIAAAAQSRGPGNAETGSKACAACHAGIYRKYSATGMANSSGRAGSGGFSENFESSGLTDSHSGASYKVTPTGEGYRMHYSRPAAGVAGDRVLKWFVGSGNVGRSYLFSTGGSLFQAPVSYYTSLAKWDLSPGYEGRPKIDLTRQVEAACLQCHASRLQILPGSQNQFSDPPFLEGGVGCERCHGAGAAHISRMTSGTRGAAAIVNPAKLPPARRDSVCGQCHLTGAARIARAGRVPFEPGRLLSESLAILVWEGGDSSHPAATSHFENLVQSVCKKSSGDRLWCGSCHDPHDEPDASTSASFYRARCLNCHAAPACKELSSVRRRNGDDCSACHMPKAQSKTVNHVAFTDHTIPRRPRPDRAPAPLPAGLVPFANAAVSERDLALAYAAVAPRYPAVRSRAFTLLRNAAARGPQDTAVAAQLAQIYDATGDEEKAFTLYSRIIASDPAHAASAVNLGVLLAKRARTREAIQLWRGALARNPALTGARLNLAVALYRSGNLAEARSELEKVIEYDPDNETGRNLLTQIQGRP